MAARADAPPPVTPEMATELGFVSVYWAIIEDSVSNAIHACIGIGFAAGDSITTEMSLVGKLNLSVCLGTV
jgi:hypothetical protein